MSVELGRREQTKAANVAAILAAGREVFGDVGYGAASVRDIIRRTELAAGTFYNYFPDKESIFRALFEDMASEARALVRAARVAAETPAAFVEDGYRAYFSFIVSDPANQAFLSRNAGTLRGMFEDSQIPLSIDDLAADLQAAVDSGRLPPVDIGYAAPVMVAIGLELGIRLLERDPPDVEGATRFASTMVLDGLRGF